jgi:phosphomannomutase
MSKTIIGVSGLRGIVGQSLDPILASRYALAFARDLPAGKVLIGRDGRETGELLARAVSSALMAAGFKVLDAGICATPTVGVLVRDLECSGGIQISASHNPAEYNGLKLFGSDGRVISATEGQSVLTTFESNDFALVPFDQVGEYVQVEDTLSGHLKRVLATVNVEAIRARNFKVLLDSNHGAGSLLARELFESLNCDAKIIGGKPDGQFEHVPEPTVENLAEVAKAAGLFGADVVFCQDPDADRLAIIDGEGNYLGEEYTLAITLKHTLAQASRHGFLGYSRKVVVNCATSRMSLEIAREFGCECVVSAVGEANVTGTMLSENAIYGGEGNGGPIDPRVGWVRDSFVGMAQTLDAMAARDGNVSRLASEIPPYCIVKSKIDLEEDCIAPVFECLETEFGSPSISRMDGLRIDFEDSWILVRASNTEPVVRVIAEATTRAIAQALLAKATDIIHNR